MTTDLKPLAFTMVAPIGGPRMLPGVPDRSTAIPASPAPGGLGQGSTVRALRPDLLLALAGFAIGAAAWLLVQGAEPTPPPPSGGTDLLIQAAAQVNAAQPGRSRS